MDADRWTDKALSKLEKRIERMYRIAGKELKETAEDYFERYKSRWVKEWNEFQAGKYTEQQFKAWEYSQLARGERWVELKEQMVQRMAEAQKVAQGYSNGILLSVYVKNNNEIASIVKASAIEQGAVGVRFDLVDEYTVKRLMEGAREVQPFRAIEINLPRINQWNMTNIQNVLLQGILQGDSIDHIADRFEKVADMNRTQSIRSARTAVTGAQSAGKQDRFNALADQGCEITKIWVATHDSRTREEHAEADGQEVGVDDYFDVGGEELMYPADRNGSDWNIYNCRCTMRTGQIKFTSILDDDTRAKAKIRVR